MSGVLAIDKPAGITSHDVVSRVRRMFNTRRVGHAGTLDPMATGVLVVCLGQATRIVDYLVATRKSYVAEAVFGIATDSQDTTGRITAEMDASTLTENALLDVLLRFTGRLLQTPPMYSAIHHEGKRLYDLARKGIEVERVAREVEVFRLGMTRFGPTPPDSLSQEQESGRRVAEFEIDCSPGTYIRTLVADIGSLVGTGAAMSSLRRTAVGRFTLADCRTLDQLGDSADIVPISLALADMPQVTMTDSSQTERIAHGRAIDAPPPNLSGTEFLLLNPSGEAVAIARVESGELRPVKVFL